MTRGAQKSDTKFSKTEGDSVREVSMKRTKKSLEMGHTQFSKTEGDSEHGPFPRVNKRCSEKGHTFQQNRGRFRARGDNQEDKRCLKKGHTIQENRG